MPTQSLSQRVASLRWRFTQSIRAHIAKFQYEHFWTYKRGKPHLLPAPLIISLASYPPRFGTLHLTLRCLLNQSVSADKIILWIDRQDKDYLPPKVTELQNSILEIEFIDRHLRSYKKIIPSLRRHPEAFIATSDDDVYYHRDWLSELVRPHNTTSPAIICHRAHEPSFGDTGRLAAYGRWQWDVAGPRESDNLFPTGVGGVLYPPGILPDMAQDEALFMRLAPTADDVWLYFMGRRAGTQYKLSGWRFRMLDWPGSQDASLNGDNVAYGGNDRQIRALEDAIGLARPH